MGSCAISGHLLLLTSLLFARGVEIENVEELVHYFFKICGKKTLARVDLDRCVESAPSDFSTHFMGGLDAKAFMVVVDLNRDGTITPEEYESSLSEEEDDRSREKIEVKDRNGNTKFMTADDLLQSMRAEHEGMYMEDGRLMKNTEGSSTVSEITKENPDLARFIAMGRWCGVMLERAGYDFGPVVGLSSSTAPEDEEDEEAHPRNGIQMNMREFKQWIQIEFKPNEVGGNPEDLDKEGDETKNKKKMKKKKEKNLVKVLLVRDPVHIPDSPHLSIERAVVLNNRGGVRRTLALPPAPAHITQASQESLDMQSALWRISLAVVVSFAVTLACLHFMGRSLSDIWAVPHDVNRGSGYYKHDKHVKED
mgnify:CR=1 FL=1